MSGSLRMDCLYVRVAEQWNGNLVLPIWPGASWGFMVHWLVLCRGMQDVWVWFASGVLFVLDLVPSSFQCLSFFPGKVMESLAMAHILQVLA